MTIESVLESRMGGRLPVLVLAVLGVLLLWTLVRLLWLVLDGPVLPPTTMPPVPEVRLPGSVDSTRVWDLFGETSSPRPVVQREAPVSPLTLRLRGVISGTDGAGFAIVSDGDREAVYRPGDEIRPGVTVEAIEPRRVIILREGQEEALELPEDRLASAGREVPREEGRSRSAPADVPMPGFRPGPAGPGLSEGGAGIASLGASARSLGLDPGTLARSINIQPVSDGGFRVRPGRDARIFRELGLQANDVVLAVNGQPLQTEADAMRIFEAFQESGQLAITVRRDGQERVLTPDLSGLEY